MFHPLFDLTGRVALVSGAAQNMGRASAIALAEIGADLLITDINEAGLLDTAETIRKLGRKVVPAVYDVWDEAQIRAMYQQIDREFGQIDIVVNIPGANILGHPEEITVEHFMKVLQATLVSKFISCQEAGRRMLARGRGSIINICSIAGVASLGRGNFAYSVGMGADGRDDARPEHRVERVAACASTPFHRRRSPTRGAKNAWPPTRRLETPSCTAFRAAGWARQRISRDWRCGWPRMPPAITGTLIPMDGGNLAMNAGGPLRGRRERMRRREDG